MGKMTANKKYSRNPDEFEDKMVEAAQKMWFHKPAQHKSSVASTTELR